MTVAVLAPNAVQALAVFRRRSKSWQRRHYVKTVIDRLTAQGLIKFKKSTRGKVYLTITDKGRNELLKYQLGDLKISRPPVWDGKWRVLIFDIREYRRGDRDRLRLELSRLGFKKLQNSVWIYPYDCAEIITLLKASFRFGRDLLYLEVNKLENDKWLRKSFNLND